MKPTTTQKQTKQIADDHKAFIWILMLSLTSFTTLILLVALSQGGASLSPLGETEEGDSILHAIDSIHPLIVLIIVLWILFITIIKIIVGKRKMW